MKKKIFPKFAIIYFLILLFSFAIILLIVDKSMVKLSLYNKDNKIIQKNESNKRNYLYNTEYPLLNYDLTKYNKKNTKKILVLGDSYIEGDGYANINDTWWKKLQVELYNRGYLDVEIIAVGKNGLSTYDEYNLLANTSMLDDINPDLLIIGYVMNDPDLKGEGEVKRIQSKNYIYNNEITNNLSKIYPNVFYKLNNLLEKKYSDNIEYSDSSGYPTEIWLDKIADKEHQEIYQRRVVKPLDELVKKKKLKTMLFTTADSVGSRARKRYEILNTYKNTSIKLYNDFDNMENLRNKYPELSAKYRNINKVNGHPGTFYTNYYAKRVANILENDYKNILGTKYKEVDYKININDSLPYNINLKKNKETNKYIEYTFDNQNNENKLYLPINEYYIKLNLEFPVSINSLEIDNSKSEIYVSVIDEKLGFDTQKLIKLEKKNNKFIIPSNYKISTINITNLKNNNKLKIYK